MSERATGFGTWSGVRVAALIAACGIVACAPAPMEPEDAGNTGVDSGGGADCVGQADGTPCFPGQVCVRNLCQTSVCGDGAVDMRTEACDDGNAVPLDGCEDDCTPSCTDDAMCDDEDPCNGSETCDPSTGRCELGTAAADGASCGDSLLCRSGACVAAECGDGFVNPSTEDCEDGNDVDGDGCDTDCRYSCTADSDCVDDGEECNGLATCDVATHTCGSTTPPAMGAACTDSTSAPGTCQGLVCVPVGCGNSVVDVGESCDDGNDITGDGCEPSCRFTCSNDGECADTNACNGAETCMNPASDTSRCLPGIAPDCNDANACTSDSCVASSGCVNTLIDADGDGEAARALGACGTDCNDGARSVCQFCSEICSNGVDDNCNGTVDDGETTWFRDCDGDDYAPAGAVSMTTCVRPPAPASVSGCSGSSRQWVTNDPVSSADCNDADAAIHPAASEISGNNVDEDCDGRARCYRDSDDDDYRTSSTFLSTDADCTDAGEALSGAGIDCCDSDDRVYPGATTWRTSSGADSNCGGWDFNCDGTATPERTDRQDTGCNWDGDSCSVSSSADGWHFASFTGICTGAPVPYPPCGSAARCFVRNCSGGFPSCSYDVSARRQGCR